MWERNPRARQIIAAENEHYSQEKVQNMEVQKYTDHLREQKKEFFLIDFGDYVFFSLFSCSSTFSLSINVSRAFIGCLKTFKTLFFFNKDYFF